MKVVFLTDKNKISSKFRNAEKLVTVKDSQRIEESITAQNGKGLVNRINEIMPDALIISWAGPAIKSIDQKIQVYEVEPDKPIDDVLQLYQQGKLDAYTNPHPPHTCTCGTCSSCSSNCGK
ncbi:MAG: hypothetical protein KKA79_00675 [Nanoarchaeota archaeon]|nr:hypothetical protein [Nanoarchaeota archaeon]